MSTVSESESESKSTKRVLKSKSPARMSPRPVPSPGKTIIMPPSGQVEITVSIKATPASDVVSGRASPNLLVKEVSFSTKDLSDRVHDDLLLRGQKSRPRTPRSRRGRIRRVDTDEISEALEPESLAMGMTCGTKCIKWLLFSFNFVLFLIGCIVAGTSLWVTLSSTFRTYIDEVLAKAGVQDVHLHEYFIVLYVLAVLGGLLALCGFLGCCGACCENRCLLGTFFVFMLLLFVAFVSGAIYVLVRRDDINLFIMTEWKKYAVDKYYTSEQLRVAVDKVHTTWHCCGAVGCDDFGQMPPKSCDCGSSPPGCAHVLISFINSNSLIIAGVLFGALALQLLAMLFSCILYQAIGRYV